MRDCFVCCGRIRNLCLSGVRQFDRISNTRCACNANVKNNIVPFHYLADDLKRRLHVGRRDSETQIAQSRIADCVALAVDYVNAQSVSVRKTNCGPRHQQVSASGVCAFVRNARIHKLQRHDWCRKRAKNIASETYQLTLTVSVQRDYALAEFIGDRSQTVKRLDDRGHCFGIDVNAKHVTDTASGHSYQRTSASDLTRVQPAPRGVTEFQLSRACGHIDSEHLQSAAHGTTCETDNFTLTVQNKIGTVKVGV